MKETELRTILRDSLDAAIQERDEAEKGDWTPCWPFGEVATTIHNPFNINSFHVIMVNGSEYNVAITEVKGI